MANGFVPPEAKNKTFVPREVEKEDKGFFASIGEAGLSGGAGLLYGAIKIPEGFVYLGAELIDLGFDTQTADKVEDFFDKMNPFEEVAEKTLTGKIVEGLTQFGVPSVAGYKIGAKLAQKALAGRKKGKHISLKKTKSLASQKRQEALLKRKQTRKEKTYCK